MNNSFKKEEEEEEGEKNLEVLLQCEAFMGG